VLTVQLALPTAQLGSVRAASAPGASGRTSHNPPVVGFEPHPPHQQPRRDGRPGQLATRDASVGARAPAVAVQHRSPCRSGLERLNKPVERPFRSRHFGHRGMGKEFSLFGFLSNFEYCTATWTFGMIAETSYNLFQSFSQGYLWIISQ
jgi:hypothetical protein